MASKAVRIWYWIVTLLFVAFMLFSGISELVQTESSELLLIQLGYPIYLNIILGVAKILGVVALIQTKWSVLKEWAYAGFTIDILGVAMSMALIGEPISAVLVTLLFLVVMFISYALWKKTN